MSTEEPPSNANDGCVGPASDNAGKASACAGCPNQSACASGAGKKTETLGLDKLSQVKHKILVLSGKGGVGKSTVSAQLAFTLAQQGKQVGLLDVDICGPSIPRMLGLVGQEVHQSASGWSPVYVDDNLGVMSIGFMLPTSDDAIIWRGPRKNGLIKQFLTDVDWGQLDYLIIDTPPGTSDEHISIVQYLKATSVDGAIIVTTPQEVAMADVRKEINFCRKTGINVIGVVENMASISLDLSSLSTPSSGLRLLNNRGEDMTESMLLRIQEHCPELLTLSLATNLFSTTDSSGENNTPADMAKRFGIPYLGSLPMDSNMMRSCEDGFSFLEQFPSSVAAAPFSSIVNQILAATPDVDHSSS
mmetsp:Transcript_16781/g.25218  ORF Transcript_16781/g.25218 Transcript_16781/m.25218 type:complete len:360 (+) Transcript_16781:40-1119(+)